MTVYYDVKEDTTDLDGDGIPNHFDLDSDGDGCFDVIEAGFDDNDTKYTEYDTFMKNNVEISLLVDDEGRVIIQTTQSHHMQTKGW